MTRRELVSLLEYSLLTANTTPQQIEKLCSDAQSLGVSSVCVNPCDANLAVQLLKESSVKTCTVVGYPLGSSTTRVKAFEAGDAVKNGVQEIDMVINIGMLKVEKYDAVREDIRSVVNAAAGASTSVIIDTCFLSDLEKKIACLLTLEAGADCVKTSTGYGIAGTNLRDVVLLKAAMGSCGRVKVHGAMKTYMHVAQYLKIGATRVGVSACSNILDDFDYHIKTGRLIAI